MAESRFAVGSSASTILGWATTARGTVSGTSVALSVPFFLNDAESELQANGSVTGDTVTLHGAGSIADGEQLCVVTAEYVFTR